MTANAQNFDLRTTIEEIVPNVFSTMLGMTPEAASTGVADASARRITGMVGIGGDDFCGAVYLHFSEAFGELVSAGMLGLNAGEKPADADVNDVVGELCNMVAGGLKSLLCDSGFRCSMAAPAIIRGAGYTIDTAVDVRREHFLFAFRDQQLAVEVHLKSNNSNHL